MISHQKMTRLRASWVAFLGCHVLLTVLLIGLFSGSVSAHDGSGTITRQIVLSQGGTTTEVYVRTPIALLFGDVLNGSAPDTEGFLVNRLVQGVPRVMLSTERIEAARAAFSARLTDNFDWRVAGHKVSSRVRLYKFVKIAHDAGAAGSAIDRNAGHGPTANGDIDITKGYVDIFISVAATPALLPLTLRAGLGTVPISDTSRIQNNIVDERGKTPVNYVVPGQLQMPVAFHRTLPGMAIDRLHSGATWLVLTPAMIALIAALALTAGTALRAALSTFALAVGLVAGVLGVSYGMPDALSDAIWVWPLALSALAGLAATSGLMARTPHPAAFALPGILGGIMVTNALPGVPAIDAHAPVFAQACAVAGVAIGGAILVALLRTALALINRFAPSAFQPARRGGMAIVAVASIALIGLYALRALPGG